MSVCEECGRDVSIGDFPFCPHGHGNNLQKPMTPYIDTQLAATPMEFSTISEKVRFMDRNGIVPRGEARLSRPSSGPSSTDIRSAIREVFREIR